MSIQDRLRKLRKQNKLTQQVTADKIGVGQVTYARYENGSRQPSTEMLSRLAKLFNVTVDYLLGLEDLNKNQAENRLSDKEYELLQEIRRSDKPGVKALAGTIDKLIAEADRLLRIDESENDGKDGK